MEKQSFFGQWGERLTSETPIWWKKFVLAGISIGGTGAALLALGATPIPLPAILHTVAGYMVTIGIVCTALAKSATTNPDLQAQGGSNVLVNQNERPVESTSAPESPPIPIVKV